jgi:predicted nuclease with TOPRIM domain
MHSPGGSKPLGLMYPIAEEDETRITILDMHELDCEVREMEEALEKMNRSLSRINRELSDYMGEKVKLEQRLRHIKILIGEALRPQAAQQCVVC